MPGGLTGGPLKLERLTTHPGSDLRQLEIQHNNVVNDAQAASWAGSLDTVWAWQTAAANSGQALGRGSTDTNIASGAFKFAINGVPEAKAAVTAGTAIGAQTVPASLWALYALDIATGGGITVTPAAGNATGYATEALAIAAAPARVTAKARMGYITVLASASTWIAATDALAGGVSGNPATTTNYYPFDGVFSATGLALGPNGTVVASTAANGAAWSGGRNGVVIPTVLSRASTDTRVALTAFTYNARGICNIAKGAVAAGTTFGALGTIPASKWGVIVCLIDSLGTVTYQSAAGNYTTGYDTEAQAIGALGSLFPAANLCMFGYLTIKASASGFVVATDALAGGASGNPASGTNYYPTAGIALPTSGLGVSGFTAAQIAQRHGTALTSANY